MQPCDYTDQMNSLVTRTIVEDELTELKKYWTLGSELVAGLPVRAFYLVSDEGYANLAILTDRSIVDIESDEEDLSAGYISVTTIQSIARVHFRAGSVQTVPNSEDAKLTVVLSMIGATGSGPYWIAETDSELRHLSIFGAALVNAINER